MKNRIIELLITLSICIILIIVMLSSKIHIISNKNNNIDVVNKRVKFIENFFNNN